MNTTVRIKASEIYKDWHIIDAAGRPLGRVASEAAILLRGKHKPTYEPHLDDGDFVIIINAAEVKVTGRKSEQIKYYTHSGYPGGLRTRTYEQQLSKHPERVLEKAVWGMLPGGSLGEAIFKHLKVYKGAHHPHQSQITGSDRAREARLEAQKGNAETPRKAPPRLRKLSVPDVAPEPRAKRVQAERPEVAAAAAKPVAAAKPKATRARTPKPEVKTPPVVDDEPVAAAPAEAAPAVTAAVAPVTKAATAKTADDAPEAAAPKRTRAKAASAEAASAEATTAKASARKAAPAKASAAKADAAAEATPEKKPARRRTPAKTEE